MRTVLLLLAGFSAGLMAGVLLTRGWGEPDQDPAAPAAPPPVSLTSAPDRIADQPAGQPSGPAADPPATIPPELGERVRERAKAIRASARQLFDQADAMAAERVLRELREEEGRRAREEAQRAGLARGDAQAILADVKERRAHPFDLLASREALDRCFALVPAGTLLDPAMPDPRDALPEALAFSFAAGRHEFAASRIRTPFSSLVLTGQGMDRTLAVLDRGLEPTAPFASIVFRDATIFADSEIVHVRQGAVVRFERCRLIGFDRGAGGSDAIGGGDLLLDAVDCRFEAGFGDAPGRGGLLDVRGVLLARFERCAFVGPLRGLLPQTSDSTCSYAACRFTDLDPAGRAELDLPRREVRFTDCAFEYLAEGFEWPRKSRPLTDLDPSFAPPDPRRRR
jgi:hypothetical protein